MTTTQTQTTNPYNIIACSFFILHFCTVGGDGAALPLRTRNYWEKDLRPGSKVSNAAHNVHFLNIMDVNNFIKTGASVQLVVNALDLRELFLEWQAEAEAAAAKQAVQQVEETYLTAKECAERLSVDLSTLWRWDKSGYLKKIKVGNKIRYRESDVLKLMEG